jgi:hypothetical protein
MSSLYDAIQRHYHGQKREIAPLNFDRVAVTGTAQVSAQPAREPFVEFSDVSEPSGPVVVGVSVAETPELEPFKGMKTGAFKVALKSAETQAVADGDKPARPLDMDAVEALEKKFWALMRVLARRGLVTKEEFLAELESA